MIGAVEIGDIWRPQVGWGGTELVGHPRRRAVEHRANQFPARQVCRLADLDVPAVHLALGVPGGKQVPGRALFGHTRVVDENIPW